MHRHIRSVATLGLAGMLLAACGGGGGAGPAPKAATSNGTTQQIGSGVTGALTLTAANGTGTTATQRKLQFVSPGALSAGVSINGGTVTYADVSSGSSLCTTTSGTRTCTIAVGAPAGSATFAVSLYDAASGGGHLLSSGTGTATVVPGTPFTVPIAMNAVVASLTNPSVNTNFTVGVAATTAAYTPIWADPAGQAITGTAPYLHPITVQFSSSHITISATQLTAPGQSFTFSYDGSPAAPASVTSTVSSGGATVYSGTVPISGLFVTRISLGTANSIYPEQITTGSDGNLWLTENLTNKIDRVTTAGVLTKFTPGFAGFLQGIATGGDGNLYVSNGQCNIYQIAPSNPSVIMNTFTVPGGTCVVANLAEDSSGNVWFLDVNSTQSRVGYVAVPGLTVNVYNTLTANAFSNNVLSGITLGSDNAIWFAEPGGAKVGRVGTPASGGTGTVSEYAVPNATANNTEPIALTKGPDNNLWLTVPNFSVTSNQFFAYFAPATPATINEYPNVINPADFANWVILTSGSDGNLWTAQGGGAVKIPPGSPTAATIEIFTDGGSTDNHSSITGPDGNIWFTGLGSSLGSVATPDEVAHFQPR